MSDEKPDNNIPDKDKNSSTKKNPRPSTSRDNGDQEPENTESKMIKLTMKADVRKDMEKIIKEHFSSIPQYVKRYGHINESFPKFEIVQNENDSCIHEMVLVPNGSANDNNNLPSENAGNKDEEQDSPPDETQNKEPAEVSSVEIDVASNMPNRNSAIFSIDFIASVPDENNNIVYLPEDFLIQLPNAVKIIPMKITSLQSKLPCRMESESRNLLNLHNFGSNWRFVRPEEVFQREIHFETVRPLPKKHLAIAKSVPGKEEANKKATVFKPKVGACNFHFSSRGRFFIPSNTTGNFRRNETEDLRKQSLQNGHPMLPRLDSLPPLNEVLRGVHQIPLMLRQIMNFCGQNMGDFNTGSEGNTALQEQRPGLPRGMRTSVIFGRVPNSAYRLGRHAGDAVEGPKLEQAEASGSAEANPENEDDEESEDKSDTGAINQLPQPEE